MSPRNRVHTVLSAALLVSIAANVSAAEPTLIGRSVAAWPPMALMLVIDVLGRVRTGVGWLGKAQILGATGVAGVAAVASFSHMQTVALDAGESELVAWLFPLTVDGLAVVASAALVQLNRTPTEVPVPRATTCEPASTPLSVSPPVSLNGPAEPADEVAWL